MAGNVTSTVTLSVAQAGLAFTNGNFSVVGAQAPYLEDNVVHGTPNVYVDGIGTLNYANLNLFYFLSDALDCTVGFYTGTDGSTGLIGSALTCYAGVPYIFATSSAGGVGSNPLGTSNSGSIKVTASLNVDGVAQTAITTTAVHARTSLTA
jgi:hypothetical protein